MYEDKTAQRVLEDMLKRVSDELDKREGSIIYDALAPVAWEIAKVYSELDNVLKETFVDTASLPNLIKRAYERGIEYMDSRKTLVAAQIEIANGDELQGNERFVVKGDENTAFYYTNSKSEDGEYILECEKSGAFGNNYEGYSLIFDGRGITVISAKITRIVEPGRNAETADELRNRYYESLYAAAFGGNIADYKEKAMNIPGVGGVQVRRVTDSDETVRLLVLNTNYKIPDDLIITAVQNYFDPKEKGDGSGMAPIDHKVKASAPQEQIINIKTTVELTDNTEIEDVTKSIENAINEYFVSLAKQWADTGTATLRISKIESAVASVEGVIDVYDTSVNNNTENIIFNGDAVPVGGEITIAEQ